MRYLTNCTYTQYTPTSYMYFFAACVVPVFIAYMLPAARSFKKEKEKNRPPEQYYSICTVHYFGSLLLSYRGEEGLLWRSNMVPTSYIPCTYNRRYVACKVANNNRNVTRRQTVENAYRYVKGKVR